ncbi:MAG: 50S ribosomal protein L24 [Thermodesulfobacteriota bacterium]
MKVNIKSGDTVYVTAGKDKGKTGKVLKVLSDKRKVIVEKVNVVKKHSKPTQKSPTGGISDKELGIDISNVMLYDSKTKSRTRVGFKINENGKKVRISKKSGEEV